MEFALHNAWLILLLPVLSALFIAALARKLGEPAAGYVGAGVMFVALLLSIGVLGAAVTHGGHAGAPFGAGGEPLVHFALPSAGPFGGKTLNLGLMVDNLTATMLVVVTLVSFCVQTYSISYMHGDKRFTRYFAAINLFTSGMLLAVMADNLLLLLVGWEIMGLCSYLLIGHWYEQNWPRMGSMKAFLTTRFGDTFMLLGIFALFVLTGSFQFNEIAAKLPEVAKASPVALIAGTLLLFGGPIGKSAQFPLHTWLPDAMAGPTPGSALIHAATMVAVGVYLIARGFTIFATAGPEVLGVVALVGFFTSIFAASIATVRRDFKEVLAYSTISQLGYMVGALGVGSFSAGTFHLTTHAFFKALLFLCAGSLIHAVHTQDMFKMGGLRKKMPITFITWMVGYLALAGFPLTSGFFSKDELLLAAYSFARSPQAPHWPAWVLWLPFVFGVGTAFLTAYYMTRATYLAFFGEPRDHHVYEHAHESPALVTVPLIILAVPALLSGFAWAHLFHIEWWEHFTAHPFQFRPDLGAAGLVTGIATAAGLSGIAIGIWAFKFQTFAFRERVAKRLGFFYLLLRDKYYIDELWDVLGVRTSLAVGRFIAWFDGAVVDGIVNLVGLAGRGLGAVHGWFDQTIVDGLVNLAGWSAVASGRQLRRLSTGQVQAYMMTFAVLVVFGAVAVWATFTR